MRQRFLVSMFCLLIAQLAHAQATRTWVSGVGDDANPCSRTAPCKTFAGAISKTAALGEINVLDPGGFGGLTVGKAITVDGTGPIAGVLVSGTNAFVINAGSTDKVVLRHLDINGLGTGITGIRILSAKSVLIEDCTIYGFQRGISIDNPTNPVDVQIINTMVHSNSSHGIAALPSSSTTVNLLINGVHSVNNAGLGLDVWRNSRVVVMNSAFTRNGAGALRVEESSDDVTIYNSVFAKNFMGVRIDAAGGTVRLYGSQVVDNDNGFQIFGGSVLSAGNNVIAANGGNQTPTSTVGLQ